VAIPAVIFVLAMPGIIYLSSTADMQYLSNPVHLCRSGGNHAHRIVHFLVSLSEK